MTRLLVFVCVVVFVDTTFYAAITPLLPDYVRELGLTKAGAGILGGSYAAGTLVAALPAGLLAKRVGVRPTVLCGLGLMTVSSVAFAFGATAWQLDAARFLQGVGGAASWAGAMAWLVRAAPANRRGSLLGTAVGAAVFGALFGPALGGLAVAIGPEIAFCGVAVVGACLLAWAVTQPAPPVESGDTGTLAEALRSRRLLGGMWIMTLPAMTFGALSVLAPLRLDALGAGAGIIGAAFIAAAALEAIASRIAGGHVDRRGAVAAARIGLATSAVAAIALPLPGSWLLLAAVVALAGPAIGILWAPAMALVSETAERVRLDQGLAFGLINLAWAGGQMLGSAGGASLAQVTGADLVPFWLAAALLLLTRAALGRGRFSRVGGRRARGATAGRAGAADGTR